MFICKYVLNVKFIIVLLDHLRHVVPHGVQLVYVLLAHGGHHRLVEGGEEAVLSPLLLLLLEHLSPRHPAV